MQSLTSRERGLKFHPLVKQHMTVTVAHLAGAWIEICAAVTSPVMPSAVAHLAGAWIEIIPAGRTKKQRKVAHLAGAWIEIIWIAALRALLIRRSPRGSVD